MSHLFWSRSVVLPPFGIFVGNVYRATISVVQPQTFLAIVVGKLVNFLTKNLKIGGGTAAPGLAALTFDKNFVKNLAEKNHLDSVVITGTNGKTTTARMLANIFGKAQIEFIHNRAGSNLLRGIAASLVQNSNLLGKLNSKWGIWEVDEAVMPEAVNQLHPKILVIGNLFRDQLDRFGEIDKLRIVWTETVKKLEEGEKLVLNGDDPQIAYLENQTVAKVFRFGINDTNYTLRKLPKAADARFCPNCQTPLSYRAVYVYHMGDYYCPKCIIRRQKPDVSATEILELLAEQSRFKLSIGQAEAEIRLSVGGLYNIYNALGAAAAASAQEVSLQDIKAGLEKFRAAFGRVEKFKVANKILTMYLVKNPAGFSEVVRTLFTKSTKKNVLLALNDNIADGTDVSWIWDVDFEPMLGKTKRVFITGKRAQDLALRLKYSEINKFELVEADIGKALEVAIQKSEKFLYLLPTYTAMLELRKTLNKMGAGTKFWED